MGEAKEGLHLLFIDGGRSKSGKGAAGAVLKEPHGTPIPGAELSEGIHEVKDPHTAEYEALLRGISMARKRDIKYVAVFSDSRTLVNQINGLYNAKGHLADYRDKAIAALGRKTTWQVSWIPRKWNEAHRLASEALKGEELVYSGDVDLHDVD